MILSPEDEKAYAQEVMELKTKYKGVTNLAYRRESSELGWKYKQRELRDEEEE